MRSILLALACAACAAPDRLTGVPVGTYLLAVGDEPYVDVHSPYSGYRELRLDVGGRPTALTVTRDGRSAVVAHEGGVTVRPLFGQPGARFHELGVTPTAVAMLTRRKQVVLAASGELLVVHLGTGDVEERHATAIEDAVGVAVSGDGRQVLVAGGTSAAVVDRTTGEVSPLTLDVDARAVAAHPDGDTVSITGEGATQRFRFSTMELLVQINVHLGVRGACYEPGGRLALVKQSPGDLAASLWVLGEDGLVASETRSLPPGPAAVRPTSGARWVFVADPERGQILVVATEDESIRGAFSAATGVHALALTRSRDRVPLGGD